MTAITDDAMVVEQESGVQVRLVEGSYQNIKIRLRRIWTLLEVFLKRSKNVKICIDIKKIDDRIHLASDRDVANTEKCIWRDIEVVITRRS